jgi:hypothetical protein
MAAAKRPDVAPGVAPEVGRFVLAFPFAASDSHPKEYRKLRPCQCFLAGMVQDRELVDQPIEGRPEIVGDFPNTDAQLGWWEDVYENAERILSASTVQLGYDNSIVGRCLKSSLLGTESFNLTHCTPDLEAWAIQRMRHADPLDLQIMGTLPPAV